MSVPPRPTTIRCTSVLVGALVIGAKAGLLVGFALGVLTALAIAWWVA